MSPGELVIYTADPFLFGKLLILEVAANGRLICEAVRADKDGTYARGEFGPHELELHTPVHATA